MTKSSNEFELQPSSCTSTSYSPIAKAGMLIRQPAAIVFEAFIDPLVTSNFWFTKGADRLQVGKQIY